MIRLLYDLSGIDKGVTEKAKVCMAKYALFCTVLCWVYLKAYVSINTGPSNYYPSPSISLCLSLPLYTKYAHEV